MKKYINLIVFTTLIILGCSLNVSASATNKVQIDDNTQSMPEPRTTGGSNYYDSNAIEKTPINKNVQALPEPQTTRNGSFYSKDQQKNNSNSNESQRSKMVKSVPELSANKAKEIDHNHTHATLPQTNENNDEIFTMLGVGMIAFTIVTFIVKNKRY